MSLARIALRTAAAKALRGATLVGNNVMISPNGALDVAADGSMRSDEERPFLAVYTDAGEVDGMPNRSLYENGSCVLVIEAGISMAMTETDPDTDVSEIVGVAIPASDENFEFFLDVTLGQVVDALSSDTEWADIYRSLHCRVSKVVVAGARTTEDGQRLAARQIKISLDLVDEPMKGEPVDPETPFGRFLDAMEASEIAVERQQAATLRGLIGGDMPDWLALQQRHGLTRAELLALGLGPLAGDADRSTPEFEIGDIELEGMGNTSTVER